MRARPKAFVLISFEDAFKSVYERLIKKPLEEAGYDVSRADSRLDQQNILKDVVLGIASADLVVADLTTLNPNVFYELGLAHSLGIPTILLTQNIEEVPFDLRPYRANEYGTHFTEAPKLQARLKEIAAAHIKGTISFGSPVTDHLPYAPRPPRPAAPAQAAAEPTPDEDEAETAADRGVLDLIEDITEGTEDFTGSMERMTAATEVIGMKVTARTAELDAAQTLEGSDALKAANSMATQYAQDLDEYATALEIELPIAAAASNRMSEATQAYLAILRTQDEFDNDQLEELRRASSDNAKSAASNRSTIASFRDTIRATPGLTRQINIASRRVVQALDQLIALSGDIEAQSSRTVSVIDTLRSRTESSTRAESSATEIAKRSPVSKPARRRRSTASKRQRRPKR